MAMASRLNSAGLDRFSGSLNLVGRATGWFHLETIDGQAWLITPEGHGFISLGVNHLGHVFSPGQPANPEAIEAIRVNLQRGGYNTWGYDGPVPVDSTTPFVGSIMLTGTGHYHLGKDFCFDDVFDPKFQETIRGEIRDYCGRVGQRANLIGYYWTDTPEWDIKLARKMRGTDWVSSLRTLGANTSGKVRYIDFLHQTYGGSILAVNKAYGLQAPSFDWLITHDFNQLDLHRSEVQRDDELFLQLIARELYRVTGEAFREFDPNHLLFGERYKMHLHPEVVLKESMRYIDVLSIQPGPEVGAAHGQGKHESEFDGALFDRLHQLTGKPILICDHSLSFYTPKYPKTLWNQYPTQRAAAYGIFLQAAMAKPYMIGFQRCQYISVFKADRGHLKQGLVETNGKPHEEFLDLIGNANRKLLNQRYRER